MLKAAAYITALTASWAQSLFAVVLLETSSSVVYMNLLCFSPAETVTDLKCKDWRKSGHELENVLVCLDQKSHRTGPFRNNHVFSFFLPVAWWLHFDSSEPRTASSEIHFFILSQSNWLWVSLTPDCVKKYLWAQKPGRHFQLFMPPSCLPQSHHVHH